MILRRIIAHLRKQEWTAIGLDLLIVVLGVFIGMQVSNWNASQVDQRALAKYMQDIAADIRADQAELARSELSALDRIGAANYMFREAGVTSAVDSITLSRASVSDAFTDRSTFEIPAGSEITAAEAGRLWELQASAYNYDMHRSAFDALVSSGKIELVRDDRLMQALREYYYLVGALTETQSRTLVPFHNYALEQGLQRGLSPRGLYSDDTLIQLVRTDRAFAAIVAGMRERAALQILLISALNAKAEEVLALLEEDQS